MPSDLFIMAKKANEFFNAGKPIVMEPEEVYQKIVVEADPGYFLLDVRKPEDFAKAQIKGAVNIAYENIYKKAFLSTLPQDKKIVVKCYIGNTSGHASLLLNLLGFEAIGMKYGMMAWSNNPVAFALQPYSGAMGYPVETEINQVASEYELPVVDSGLSDPEEIILFYGKNFIWEGRPKGSRIDPQDLFTEIVQKKNHDYFVVSLQKPDDYARGHIPGAINIPPEKIAEIDSLKKLPPGKKIVTYSYTGNTSAMVSEWHGNN